MKPSPFQSATGDSSPPQAEGFFYIPDQDVPTASNGNLRRLVLELQTRQVELQAQNSALEMQLASLQGQVNAAREEKTQFLANISHEIRTPLNVVIGLSDLLQRTPLSDRQAEFLSTLHDSAASLMVLINQLLSFSKMEAEEPVLHNRSFSFRELLEEVASSLSEKTREKGLDIILECDPEMPDLLFGDIHRIQQILINLISNAVKFTLEGSVTVLASGIMHGPRYISLEISVVDTGIGIPDDKKSRIFDIFTQADSSMTRKFGGTGMGLAVTRKLVESMNGQIHVSSALGHGSVFCIEIPLQVSQAADQSIDDMIRRADSKCENDKGHILLVEDHAPNALLATNYLYEFGYCCDVARNGREAIDCFRKCSYDAILMDVQMPEMDGYEATSQIRAMEEKYGLPAIPIIAMTAHALSDDRKRCLDAGMNDYVPKPFDALRLQEKLMQILEK